MKKILLILLPLLFVYQGADAKSKKIDRYGRRHYRIALNLTNPLSAYTKYGAGLEERNGNVSYLTYYTKYTGAYPGYQFGAEIQGYLRTRSKHQYYLYVKGLAGDAGFNSDKLSIYGDNSKIVFGATPNHQTSSFNTYAGGGFGFGKRYNFNVLFIRWNFGVKACALVGDVPIDEKHLYRLMFVTGPASILEFNVHVGLQL